MTGKRFLRKLARGTSGVAMVEFALGAPFLLMAGLWGVEMANYALVNMKISQLALHIADNASRVGDTSTLQNRKIYESDINDLLFGAQLQAAKINLFDNGRVFVSSVEYNGTQQYIHWQRCRGAKNVTSSYGNEGATLGTVGIGPSGAEVAAQPNDAVIFVQINYTYQPLITNKLITQPDIQAIASFTVRDSRDLTQIYQRDTAKPDPVQSCSSAKKGNMTISANGTLS
jgi:Flp pilus assembly protein TadG